MGDLAGAIEFYRSAAEYVNSGGLREEIEQHRERQFDQFSEPDFLRESAWVILCSGFRERTVRRAFDHISLSFCDWESAASIVVAGDICIRSAAARFRNVRKLNAILEISERVEQNGFARLKRDVLARPIETLTKLPYIGGITAWHLAKNLGLDVSKPDRHLMRLSTRFDFCCADNLCASLASAVGEAPKVVDLILWRYLADNASVKWIA